MGVEPAAEALGELVLVPHALAHEGRRACLGVVRERVHRQQPGFASCCSVRREVGEVGAPHLGVVGEGRLVAQTLGLWHDEGDPLVDRVTRIASGAGPLRTMILERVHLKVPGLIDTSTARASKQRVGLAQLRP
jgi:hypothetical protein